MDVLLVGLNTDLREMRALIASAGYRLIAELLQRRSHPDPRFFVGKGKLEDLKKTVKEKRPQAVVFAGTLRPSQHYELEKALEVQCFDRLRVILEIFTQRAHGQEANLQVELAMLQYEVPILKEWIHAAALGERPGFMAGGEYRVDAYYETVKRKMKKIRDDLETVREQRARRRDHRQRRGFYQVSLTGYANAGKSSLFNALSGEEVLVDDRLFTTLSTTTRALGDVRRRILLTDTVGFVSNVPLWLVEAFHSTFEEVFTSDLVLLLLDASDSFGEFQAKADLAVSTLVPSVDVDRVQPVLTKVDLVSNGAVDRCATWVRDLPFHRPSVSVSVKTGQGLDDLHDSVVREFQHPVQVTVCVPQGPASGPFLNWLHERTEVISVNYDGFEILVRLRCRERDVPRIAANGRMLDEGAPIT